MNVASRPVATGKTRTCPHCKAVILESLTICPGCMHHLRFDSEAARRQVAANTALRVEGVIRHPPLEEAWEYYVVIAVRNDRGEEVTRHVVNVGALQPAEKRTFSLSVEVLPPQAPPEVVLPMPAQQGAGATTQAPAMVHKPSVPMTPAQAAGLRPPQPGAPAPKLGSGSLPPLPPVVTRPSGQPPPGSRAPQPTSPMPQNQKPPQRPSNPGGQAVPGRQPGPGVAQPGAVGQPPHPGSPVTPAAAPQTPAQKAGLKPPPIGGGGPKRH